MLATMRGDAIVYGDDVTHAWLPLRWADNTRSCAVAVLAHALAGQGLAVRVVEDGVADLRAGDYLLENSDAVRRAVADSGLVAGKSLIDSPVDSRAHALECALAASHPLALPRIAIFGGTACAYPYLGYYAQSLASLGLRFEVLDAAPLAAGALTKIDLLILPGGFTNWGLDRNEGLTGVDAAIRDFLARGGACIASCGGAFYLAEGRPHWLGVACASPRFSHEYLRSGAGLVSIELGDTPLARGCAPIVEMPYYHGPIFEAVRAPTATAARFCALTLPARLPIDNPLDEARFHAEMAGKPAILTVFGATGRAVLFSPHPEMGDVVRKYIALDSYVAHYLPIRGAAIMEQTLDLYEPIDSPSFRLILNAIDYVCGAPTADARHAARINAPALDDGGAWESAMNALLGAIDTALDALAPAADPLGRLVSREIGRLHLLAEKLAGVPAPAVGTAGALRVLRDARASVAEGTEPREQPAIRVQARALLAIELPLRYLEALARAARLNLA